MQPTAIGHSIYYLRRNRQSGARGTYWAFSFHDSNGALLLEAHFPEMPKQAILFEPGRPESPLVSLKAWRWFWWNGRYDVVDSRTGTVLATLRRTGGIEGMDRRKVGRVCHSTPLRKSLVQSLFVGLLSLVFSQGNEASTLPVDEFRVETNGLAIGTLRRVRLPFSPQAEAVETTNVTRLQRWFRRFRSAIRNRLDSGGWQLDFSADETGIMDPRVRLAAALFRIQIEERYS